MVRIRVWNEDNTATVCVLSPEAVYSSASAHFFFFLLTRETETESEKQQINHQIMHHTVALSVLFKVELKRAIIWTQDKYLCALFFFSLTKQNRCPHFRANIPSFSFPRGKVPFSLPAWGKSTKATAILDYSLVNMLYLFQFSLQIVFPCPKVKWDVLGQPQGLLLNDVFLAFYSTVRLK